MARGNLATTSTNRRRDASATETAQISPARNEVAELSIDQLDRVTGGCRKAGGSAQTSGTAFLRFDFSL
jgi:hypothetical protein